MRDGVHPTFFERVTGGRVDPITEQLVNEEEQESLVKEAARLLQIKAKGEHYAGIAQAKVASDHQAKGDEEVEDTTDGESLDPGGIYSRQSYKDDSSFSYHDSEASSADEDEEELDEGASGFSPQVRGRFETDDAFAAESFEWMKEVESRGIFDKKDLLAEPINHIFPCVACNDQRNILDPST